MYGAMEVLNYGLSLDVLKCLDVLNYELCANLVFQLLFRCVELSVSVAVFLFF